MNPLFPLRVMLLSRRIDKWSENIGQMFFDDNLFRLTSRFVSLESIGPPQRALVVAFTAKYLFMPALCFPTIFEPSSDYFMGLF